METALEEVAVKKRAREVYEPPTIKDPWELMARFYKSDRFEKAYKAFYHGKQIDSSVNEKEKERVFLENDAARIALLDFATHDVLFRFGRSKFPSPTQEAIDNYVKSVRDLEKMDRGMLEKEDLAAMDEFRLNAHQEAARSLVRAGIAPTMAIGEAIARLILIDKGLDTPISAQRESTSEKLRQKLGTF